jgi:hypothetical protein
MEMDIFQEEILEFLYLEENKVQSEKIKQSTAYGSDGPVGKVDIFELIKDEHRAIYNLLSRIDQANDLNLRKKLFKYLKGFFLLHIYLEEKVLYSVLGLFKPTHKLVSKFHSGNNRIIFLFNELENVKLKQKWQENYFLLRKQIAGHISEEESTLFSLALNMLDKRQRTDLVRIIRYEKRRLLSFYRSRAREEYLH